MDEIVPPGHARAPRGVGRIRLRRVVFLALVVVLLAMAGWYGRIAVVWLTQLHRTTPVFEPPVLAGQFLANGCSGGVYARTSDGRIVLTTTGHCLLEGDTAYAPDGRLVGNASAPTGWATCDRPGKNRCTASDMAYVPVLPEMIPWGHLDLIDMGAGGYRTIAPGTTPLSCADVAPGDGVEHDGQGRYRTGVVVGTQANDFPEDGTYFPCIVVSDAEVGSGDSGGVVLVNGLPAGVNSRSYGGHQGFTPLADGLSELGLTMCDTPDCGLVPPAAGAGATTTR